MRATLQSLFIGAVVAMLTVLAAPAARAQPAAQPAVSTFAQAAAFAFDLPAQPLADSLRAVASVTRINIVFDPNVVAGMRAPPLRGSATARDALRTLLAGTGLTPVSVSAGTIRISRITARDRIAARAATGSSGTARVPGATSLSPGTSAPAVAAAAASSDPPVGTGSANGDSSTQPPAAADDASRAQLSEV
ncbi:MAG: STN domain-containing protein, partial [Steroidobacteraceae bacterium]